MMTDCRLQNLSMEIWKSYSGKAKKNKTKFKKKLFKRHNLPQNPHKQECTRPTLPAFGLIIYTF